MSFYEIYVNLLSKVSKIDYNSEDELNSTHTHNQLSIIQRE